jgi:hypothetical protein
MKRGVLHGGLTNPPLTTLEASRRKVREARDHAQRAERASVRRDGPSATARGGEGNVARVTGADRPSFFENGRRSFRRRRAHVMRNNEPGGRTARGQASGLCATKRRVAAEASARPTGGARLDAPSRSQGSAIDPRWAGGPFVAASPRSPRRRSWRSTMRHRLGQANALAAPRRCVAQRCAQHGRCLGGASPPVSRPKRTKGSATARRQRSVERKHGTKLRADEQEADTRRPEAWRAAL